MEGKIEIDPMITHTMPLADINTAFGGAKGRTDVPKIVDMYMTGKIEIDPMITHVMGLEDINKGFDLMHAGESIRSVVVY